MTSSQELASLRKMGFASAVIPAFNELPITSLAWLGDAVYELYVRQNLFLTCRSKSGQLHKLALRYVSAEAQAEAAGVLYDTLTDEDQALFQRARNTKPKSRAKNADPRSYALATAVEAVIAKIYLSGDLPYLERSLKLIYEVLESEQRDS
ncbi:MAG: ribonuclease III domain-containing protein [Eubacteriales bacterium]|nr:ribonuclease III domain-containing protein [Eubacteriales bacterium]